MGQTNLPLAARIATESLSAVRVFLPAMCCATDPRPDRRDREDPPSEPPSHIASGCHRRCPSGRPSLPLARSHCSERRPPIFTDRSRKLRGQIDGYISFKGALCYQSDPLVEVVRKMLDHFFGISLTIDDKCIEDATLLDDEGTIQAVFEIKGVKGNFTRANVNQVDSHRERLSLPSTVPGVLIMNTLMGADSLQEKDQAPHPDIIQKAVADHVLLIRTLDLLRYADGIEQGKLTKEAFRNTILTESGWLKVEGKTATIVKG